MSNPTEANVCEAAAAAASSAAPAAAAATSAAAAGKRKKSRRWVFTINNPTRPLPDRLPRGGRYLVYQVERGASGTEHLQGYVEFNRDVAFSGAVACLEGDYACPQPRGHWEIAVSPAAANKQYCTKPDGRVDGPFEYGAPGGGQGARSDLAATADAVRRTGRISDAPAEHIVRYGAGLMRLANFVAAPYRPELRVVCICGPTGVGKSYAVRDRYPDAYVPYYGNSGLWWDGYDGQPVALLEEFRGQVPLQKLLQLLDPYPTKVECKGGSLAARFTVVFITTNCDPTTWYADDRGVRGAEFNALYRRLGFSDDANNGRGYFVRAEDRESLGRRLDDALVGAVPAPERGGLERLRDGGRAEPAAAGAAHQDGGAGVPVPGRLDRGGGDAPVPAPSASAQGAVAPPSSPSLDSQSD